MSYISSQKNQLIDSLENQILYANLACVVIGEAGLGKSFLLEAIRNRVKSDVFISEITAEPVMTQTQLEKAICLQLGLSWQQSGSSLLDKLAKNSERRTLLTIDDAEKLGQSCLDYLMEIVEQQLSSGETHLFVLLSGEVSLAKKLSATPTLKANPNICALFELQPFELAETRQLIANFQATDAETIDAIYDTQKLEYFWQLSNGNPGNLEYQVKRWVSQDKIEKSPKTEKNTKFAYFSAIGYGVVAVVLILALLNQERINQIIGPAETKKENIAAAEPKLVSDKNEPSEREQENKVKQKEAQIEIDKNISTTSLDTAPKEKIQSAELQPSETLSKQDLESKEELVKLDSREDSIESLNIDESNSTKEKNVSAANISESNSPQSKVASLPNKETSPNKISSTPDEIYLLSLSDSTFTLQWVGVSELKSAEKFRSNHPLADSMKIFERRTNGKSLFLIVSGNFNSKLDASNARDIYKQRGYTGSPWIKSMAAVKSEIAR